MAARRALSARYVSTLALAALLILGGGWLLRPPEDVPRAVPLTSENELARLARLTQRRSLESMTDYFEGVAREVDGTVLRVPGVGANGVVWDTGRVVTVPFRRYAAEPITLATARDVRLGRVTISGPDLPLASIALPEAMTDAVPARRAPEPPAPGDWVVLVWHAGRDRLFAPATFLHRSEASCARYPVEEIVSSVPPGRAMAGGGLFDIDGSLLAVVLPCEDRFAAVTPASVEAILGAADTPVRRLLARYGLMVGRLTPEEGRHFGVERGAVVREVWIGHPADEAGMAPGDVVLAVNGSDVLGPEDLGIVDTLSEPETVELTLRRGDRRLVLPFPRWPDDADEPEPDGDAGFVWERAPRGFRIEAVRAGSRAAASGIQAGDRLVRVDHLEPTDLAQVGRLLEGPKALPAFVELQRDGRRWGVLLQ